MLRRAGLLLFGVLLGLCAAEGLARLYLAVVPPPADAPHVAHRDAGYLLAPDPPEHHAQEPDDHVNALGFRDREHARAKPPRTLRIAGIGDSFVYGSTSRLADHFLLVAASRLEERIRSGDGAAAGVPEGGPSASTAVEMVLLGLGGYSPENYLGVLRGIALPLRPDLVILNFYVGNDVTGLPLRGRVWHGRLYYTGSPYAWLDLLRRSRLFVLAERVVRGGSRARLVELWLRRRGPAPAPARPEPGAGLTVWQAHQQKKDLPVYLAEPDARTARLWARALECLEAFDRLCRTAGVPWILHLIPADIQVEPGLRDRVLERLHLDPGGYDFAAPQRRLRAWADARGVPVADPLEALRAAADSVEPAGPLYERRDIHWTALGNRLAGEALADVLAADARLRAYRAE